MKKNIGIAIWSLVLRILTLVSVSYGLFVTIYNVGHRNVSFDVDQHGIYIEGRRLMEFLAYRFVLCIALIAEAYTLLQLPFAIYYARKGRRAYKCLPGLDFYGDKLISLLLAMAVGACFADAIMILIVVGIVLLVGTVCMAVVSVLSSINRSSESDTQV